MAPPGMKGLGAETLGCNCQLFYKLRFSYNFKNVKRNISQCGGGPTAQNWK